MSRDKHFNLINSSSFSFYILLFFKIKQYSTRPSEPQFLGINNNFTNNIQFINEDNYEPIPIYRILESQKDKLPEDEKVWLTDLKNTYNTFKLIPTFVIHIYISILIFSENSI